MNKDQDIEDQNKNQVKNNTNQAKKKEIGGYKGKEPTEYGDWQHKGRVSDF